jgi:hypothetical protein
MTWYADEILTVASTVAVNWAATSPFADFAYVLPPLDDSCWHYPMQPQEIPKDGLLVIRPIGSGSSNNADWYGMPLLDWSRFQETAPPDTNHSEVDRVLSAYLDEDSIPPPSFRRFLCKLSRILNQPMIYYACAMWGGEIDYEYSLIYSPDESIVTTNSWLSPEVKGESDSLRAGLQALGVHLPSSYFAPHTRSFPWEMYRIDKKPKQLSHPATCGDG